MQRNFRWDIGLFSVSVKKRTGKDRKISHLKDSGIRLQMSWKRQVGDVRTTSVRNFRTQSVHFARSILQISSVSTEQPRTGVMNWLRRFLVNHFQAWRNPLWKWMSSKIENWSLKRRIRWYKHLRRMFRQREIDCVMTKRNSKINRWMCESAGFMRKVSVEQYFRTIHDLNDGSGGKAGSCREYTLSRDQDSELIGWIRGHTRIGPVRQVRAICCLDQYGIEIQVPSTPRNGSYSWIVISRGPNRYVDDPPQHVEMVSSTSVEQSHAAASSIEGTHASKQQEQSSLSITLLKSSS